MNWAASHLANSISLKSCKLYITQEFCRQRGWDKAVTSKDYIASGKDTSFRGWPGSVRQMTPPVLTTWLRSEWFKVAFLEEAETLS